MRLLETLVSLWVWFLFGVAIVVVIPVMLILLVVTRRHDPGRYLVGRVFGKSEF